MLNALKALKNNDGMTLKNGKAINYKTGWQVADYGKECKTPEDAVKVINEMNGNCGIWYSDGIYYVDHSMRVKTKREAMAIGRANNQISILKWSDMSLAYC